MLFCFDLVNKETESMIVHHVIEQYPCYSDILDRNRYFNPSIS